MAGQYETFKPGYVVCDGTHYADCDGAPIVNANPAKKTASDANNYAGDANNCAGHANPATEEH
jgi:hypothetical protein